MRKRISMLFWSEERREREHPRPPRRRFWLHPLMQPLWPILLLGAVGIGSASHRSIGLTVFGVALLAAALTMLAANQLLVRRQSRSR
jgi:hypothetical protein